MTGSTEHTFVVLAYKESPYLERCLASLAAQTVSSTIIISTSTPNAHITAAAERFRIPVTVNPRGGTIGRDWNFGFEAAASSYVTLAHQDDEYLPRFAESCLAAARENHSTQPLFVFTRSAVRRGDSAIAPSYKNAIRLALILPFHFRRAIRSRFWKRFILRFSNSISCPGVLYVKENLSGFRFNPEARYILDWQAWLDLSERDGAFVYAPEVLHVHREHEGSATASTELETLQREEFDLLCRIWGNTLIPRLIVSLLRFAK